MSVDFNAKQVLKRNKRVSEVRRLWVDVTLSKAMSGLSEARCLEIISLIYKRGIKLLIVKVMRLHLVKAKRWHLVMLKGL